MSLRSKFTGCWLFKNKRHAQCQEPCKQTNTYVFFMQIIPTKY